MPPDERQDDVAAQAEAVEGRKKAEEDVAALEAERGGADPDVGEDIAMGERHGLGRFFRAGGEEDDGGFVGIDLGQARENACREESEAEQRGERLELADVLAQILEEDVFDAVDLDAEHGR